METLFIIAITTCAGMYLYYLLQEGKNKTGTQKQVEPAKAKKKTVRQVHQAIRPEPDWVKKMKAEKESKEAMVQPDLTLEKKVADEAFSQSQDLTDTTTVASSEITLASESKYSLPFNFELSPDWELVDDPDPIRELGLRALKNMEEGVPVNEFVNSVHEASLAFHELSQTVMSGDDQDNEYEQVLALGKKIDESNVGHLFVDDLVNLTDLVEKDRPNARYEMMKAFGEINARFE